MTPLDFILLAVFAALWLVPLAMASRWESRLKRLSEQAARWDAAARETP